MKKQTIIYVSIFAGLIVAGLIIVLSFLGPDGMNPTEDGTAAQVMSPAPPGENNTEINKELTADKITGRYIENTDGWYYEFAHQPQGEYDGTYEAGYDASHELTAVNANKDLKENGFWKLENGEIKLYCDGEYKISLLACDDYLIDTKVYFVGEIDADVNTQQTVLVSKAAESGDTQILNFYDDGKLIMEVVRDDGSADSTATFGATANLPPYEMFAGTYEKTGDKLAVSIMGASREYYIVEDGLAMWIYRKK